MVTQAGRSQVECGRVLAEEIDAVASPLIGERLRARCCDSEAGRLASGNRRVLRLRRDNWRLAFSKLNFEDCAIDVTVVETAFEIVKNAIVRDLQIHRKVRKLSEELGRRSVRV